MEVLSTAGRLQQALKAAAGHLVSQMGPEGFWEGHLSSSALSTATAVSALATAGGAGDRLLIDAGCRWLEGTQGIDGGWGDTPDSPANPSTTLLVLSALTLAGRRGPAVDGARACVDAASGGGPGGIAGTVLRIYGDDRTFAVPILVNCALAGLVPWDRIPALPFELAAFPRAFFKALRLQVVSYALPALIAMGFLLHRRSPARALPRLLRALAAPAALRKLERLQPESGGFLEAVPLTSFIAMSLAPVLGAAHPVAARCLRFLRGIVRDDGSWPIDSNLSVWLTTAAVSALRQGDLLDGIDAARTLRWIAGCQERRVHPYTGAAPGAWAWTHLSGGVPDADDTAGAILVLAGSAQGEGAGAGVRWLLRLQNRDGGWPTFCRGWGKLPFDRSSPDITAHALRALRRWDPEERDPGVRIAVRNGLSYLSGRQEADGSWIPLWFGSQGHAGRTNPVYGTARVLRAYEDLGMDSPPAARGARYLLSARNPDGGWGGAAGVPSSVEETALAVAALAGCGKLTGAASAAAGGAGYLLRRMDDGSWERPAPIGLYFASLWYSERLYPVVWTVEALARAAAPAGGGP